jgi:hypothetical protein
VTYAGSFITQHPQLRAQQAAAEALAMAGVSAVIDKGPVESPEAKDAKGGSASDGGSWISNTAERFKNVVLRGMFKTDAQVDEWGRGIAEAQKLGPDAVAAFLRDGNLPTWPKEAAAVAVTGGLSAEAQLVKGVTNPEVAKLAFPKIANYTNEEVGRLIGWGAKASGAEARALSVTAREVGVMEQQGLTRADATEIRDFYANEFARNAKNATAQARVNLMNNILKWMDK